MFSENDFYLPHYKYEYVQWLKRNYEKNKNGDIINWDKFPLKRLKAIYIGIRKNENVNASPNKSVGLRQEKKKDSSTARNATRQNSSSNKMGKVSQSQVYFDFSTQSYSPVLAF